MTLTATAALFAAAPIHGSKTVLLGCFAVLIGTMIVGTRHGYWRGPVRQLAPTIALVIAIFVAWLGGAAFGHSLFKASVVPWLLRGMSGMLLLGLMVWLVAFGLLWRFGRSRFPNHLGESENPVIGAFVGCWTAILWTFAFFLLVCAVAALGQFWLNNSQSEGGLVRGSVEKLVRLKNSLALVRGCAWLENWNPLPGKTRQTLEKGILVVNTPGAQRHLSRLQPIRAIATHPAFFPLSENEEIRNLAFCKRDVEGLLSHPLVLQMLADDDFQSQIAKIDLAALFDEALEAARHAIPVKGGTPTSEPPSSGATVAPPTAPVHARPVGTL